MKSHYTTQEIADMSGVSLATVNNWIKSGTLEAFKTPGGHNRIRSESLKKFLDKNNIPLPPALKVSTIPKILVVEDDEDVREFVMLVLDELDFKVEKDTAVDGFSAGAKVHSFKPDLVILDIMLPGIDGFDVCRQIRKDFGEEIKVLAMTGYYKDENKQKIMNAGADAFLRKPIILKELKDNISKLLTKGRNKYFIKKKEDNLKNELP